MAVDSVNGVPTLTINLWSLAKLVELSSVEKQTFLILLTALIEGHEVFHLQGMNEEEARRETIAYLFNHPEIVRVVIEILNNAAVYGVKADRSFARLMLKKGLLGKTVALEDLRVELVKLHLQLKVYLMQEGIGASGATVDITQAMEWAQANRGHRGQGEEILRIARRLQQVQSQIQVLEVRQTSAPVRTSSRAVRWFTAIGLGLTLALISPIALASDWIAPYMGALEVLGDVIFYTTIALPFIIMGAIKTLFILDDEQKMRAIKQRWAAARRFVGQISRKIRFEQNLSKDDTGKTFPVKAEGVAGQDVKVPVRLRLDQESGDVSVVELRPGGMPVKGIERHE